MEYSIGRDILTPMNFTNDERYAHLVEKLKEAREASGLTQTEIAEKLGMTQPQVSKVENRERRLDMVELCDWLGALNVSVVDFLLTIGWVQRAVPVTAIIPAEKLADLPDLGSLPERDSDWTDEHWRQMIDWFLQSGLLTSRELAALMLGQLNPSQVGTSIASKSTFQQHFPPRKIMQAVIKWHFEQTGTCTTCGTRLDLQADHMETRQDHGDDADRLENMTLRCRRCNVIRRPSHKHGGKTFLTAEAALMWILFTKRPRTYQAFDRLCRDYGMTMANIRFQEAWAMARWLQREGKYQIDSDSKH